MKITYEMLVEWNACKPRRDAFREQFPDGATIEEAGAWARNDDLQWVVCKASPAMCERARAELDRRSA